MNSSFQNSSNAKRKRVKAERADDVRSSVHLAIRLTILEKYILFSEKNNLIWDDSIKMKQKA